MTYRTSIGSAVAAGAAANPSPLQSLLPHVTAEAAAVADNSYAGDTTAANH